jgi:hypothetical protein
VVAIFCGVGAPVVADRAEELGYAAGGVGSGREYFIAEGGADLSEELVVDLTKFLLAGCGSCCLELEVDGIGRVCCCGSGPIGDGDDVWCVLVVGGHNVIADF